MLNGEKRRKLKLFKERRQVVSCQQREAATVAKEKRRQDTDRTHTDRFRACMRVKSEGEKEIKRHRSLHAVGRRTHGVWVARGFFPIQPVAASFISLFS